MSEEYNPYNQSNVPNPPQPSTPPTPPVPPYVPPVPAAPLNAETAYAWMYFLGSFGVHKFYLGQKKLWYFYPLFLLVTGILTTIPVLGTLVYIVALALFAVNIYVDIRTMKEQINRVESGEVFTLQTQINLFKRVIFKK